ncbi:MAG: hypothetical protein FWD08_04405, partial [Alphaproteobacteria bacterium]|nr:hypothetical protein [Alphaproteobacteria bacterium]
MAMFFLFFTGAFYLLFSNFESGHTAGKAGESLGYQVLFVATYGLLSYKLIRSWRTVLETLIQSVVFLLLIESALISFLIVGADTTSLIRFSMYTGTILAGLLVAVTYKFDDVVTTFFWTSV